MKPTLPEDRELETMGSEVSERYRAGAQDEPPARLDAAIQAAARREVTQPPLRRNWQMPASIAAMLVRMQNANSVAWGRNGAAFAENAGWDDSNASDIPTYMEISKTTTSSAKRNNTLPGM